MPRLPNALLGVVSRAFAIPVLGYGLRMIVGVLKLPRITYHLRRIDSKLDAHVASTAATLASHLQRVHVDIEAHMASAEATLASHLQRIHADIEELRARIDAVASQQMDRADPDFHDKMARTDAILAQFPRLAEAVTATQTSVRMLQRAAVKPVEVVSPSLPAALLIDPQIEVVPEVLLRREPPRSLNRLPRMADWATDSPLSRRMTELREPHTMHRKQWEYAICIEGLHGMGVVAPQASGLAVGARSERPLYHYANQIARMVATDLYDNPEQEGQPAMLTDPARFAPFPYREDHLEVMRMPGDALDFPDGSFDFAFCLSSIAHLGSRATQRKALDEMARVVRPGGAVCIITELVLNGERHSEYFLPSEVQDMFLQHPALRLEGGGPEWRISDLLLACPVDVRVPADLTTAPHLVLFDGRVMWTSASLFFRRQA